MAWAQWPAVSTRSQSTRTPEQKAAAGCSAKASPGQSWARSPMVGATMRTPDGVRRTYRRAISATMDCSISVRSAAPESKYSRRSSLPYTMARVCTSVAGAGPRQPASRRTSGERRGGGTFSR